MNKRIKYKRGYWTRVIGKGNGPVNDSTRRGRVESGQFAEVLLKLQEVQSVEAASSQR